MGERHDNPYCVALCSISPNVFSKNNNWLRKIFLVQYQWFQSWRNKAEDKLPKPRPRPKQLALRPKLFNLEYWFLLREFYDNGAVSREKLGSISSSSCQTTSQQPVTTNTAAAAANYSRAELLHDHDTAAWPVLIRATVSLLLCVGRLQPAHHHPIFTGAPLYVCQLSDRIYWLSAASEWASSSVPVL